MASRKPRKSPSSTPTTSPDASNPISPSSTRSRQPRRPRMHPRSPPLPQCHRRGCRQTPHGLRLPRPDHLLARPRHAHGRTHRKRIQRGTRPLLRRHDRHPRRNPGRRKRPNRSRNNPLKNAPHTAEVLTADKWDRPYSREQAAYPVPSLREYKFWPPVSRIDNVYGDRNLVCSCAGMEAYTT